MRSKLVIKCLTAICSLVASLSVVPVQASWYVDKSGSGYYKPQEYYNDKYGDFPPADIDQKLMSNFDAINKAQEEKTTTQESNKPQVDNTATTSDSNQTVPTQPQNYSQQVYQQPAYGRYPGNYYNPNQRYNRNTNFSGPWNNRRNTNRSNFSGPWNNNRSGFSGPWNNNGSNFSAPWDNNGSNFSGPWNNNGSSFSAPWGNNGSGFNPMGNGSSWSW